MVKKASALYLSLLLLSTVLYLFANFQITEQDLKDHLLSQAPPQEQENLPITYSKEGVQKELFLGQKGSRLHHRLICHKAHLHIAPHLSNTSEQMQKVHLFLEENPHQMRFFKADEGTYHYHSGAFSSPEVSFTFFTQPKETPIAIPFLRGKAKNVQGRFPKELSLQADQVAMHKEL